MCSFLYPAQRNAQLDQEFKMVYGKNEMQFRICKDKACVSMGTGVLACGGEVDGERVRRRLADHGVRRHEVLEHAAVGIHGGSDERTDRRRERMDGSTKRVEE